MLFRSDYAGHYDSSYQYQAYSDEEKAQFKQQADLLAQTISNGASMEDAAQAVGLTTTTGTYATYVDHLQHLMTVRILQKVLNQRIQRAAVQRKRTVYTRQTRSIVQW